MLPKINCKGTKYPFWQATGFASRFAFPFASQVCNGLGMDVGCMKVEWAFPGSVAIDQSFGDGLYHANNLPAPDHIFPNTKEAQWDYIFSSHCLEHIEYPYTTLNYWHSVLKPGGVVFLYLPDHSQAYWRPWNKQNSPHHHVFTPGIIKSYFEDLSEMWEDVTVSNVDLNNSFIAFAYKK